MSGTVPVQIMMKTGRERDARLSTLTFLLVDALNEANWTTSHLVRFPAPLADQEHAIAGIRDCEGILPLEGRKNGGCRGDLIFSNEKRHAACGLEEAGGDWEDTLELFHGTQGDDIKAARGIDACVPGRTLGACAVLLTGWVQLFPAFFVPTSPVKCRGEIFGASSKNIDVG